MDRQYFIESSLGKVAVWDTANDAPPVFFIHGNSACKEAFAKQFGYGLGADYRLVAFDLPGHGESDNLADCERHANVKTLAAHISDVMEALNVAKPVVVGWSLGGHLALEMLGSGAEFSGLVISGTPPCGPGADDMAEAFIPSDAMALTGKERFSEEEASTYFQALYGQIDPGMENLGDAVLRAQGTLRGALLQEFGTPGTAYSQKQVVAENPCPIAVLEGRDEPFVEGDYFQSLAWANLWRDRVEFIDDAGHAPFWQQPRAFNALLLEFLKDLNY